MEFIWAVSLHAEGKQSRFVPAAMQTVDVSASWECATLAKHATTSARSAFTARIIVLPAVLLLCLVLLCVVFRCSLSLCVVFRCSRPTGGLSHRLDTASLCSAFLLKKSRRASQHRGDALRSQLVTPAPRDSAHASSIMRARASQHTRASAQAQAQARALRRLRLSRGETQRIHCNN